MRVSRCYRKGKAAGSGDLHTQGLHILEVFLGCYMDGSCTDEGLHSWVLNRGFAQQRGYITGSFIAWWITSLGDLHSLGMV